MIFLIDSNKKIVQNELNNYKKLLKISKSLPLPILKPIINKVLTINTNNNNINNKKQKRYGLVLNYNGEPFNQKVIRLEINKNTKNFIKNKINKWIKNLIKTIKKFDKYKYYHTNLHLNNIIINNYSKIFFIDISLIKKVKLSTTTIINKTIKQLLKNNDFNNLLKKYKININY